jgi:protein-tyrosine phosphatase
MAAALFRDLLDKHGGGAEWQVSSAGTWAEPGLPASPGARSAMAERGLSLEAHRSLPVTGELLGQQDLILVMGAGQHEAICAEFPGVASRVRLLSALAGPAYDISDPIGGTNAAYRVLADELRGILERGYAKLVSLLPAAPRARREPDGERLEADGA